MTGILNTGLTAPEISQHNKVLFVLSSPPHVPYYGVKMQNCRQSIVNDNDVYKSGTTAGATYNNLLYGYAFDVGAIGSTITNNYARKMNAGFHFGGSNNVLAYTCNFMEYNFTGLELISTNIGDQGAAGVAEDNQWTLTTLPSSFGAKNVASAIPKFFTRTASHPFGLLPGDQSPSGSAVFFPVTAAINYTCAYGCASPPCIVWHVAKMVKKNAPFDNLSVNDKDISYFNTYYLLKENPSIYNQGTPDDIVISNFKDSLSFTNIGSFYEISDKARLGDTLGAKIINDAIVPKDCKEQSQKIVNKIFLSTWARGNFELSDDDIIVLQTIADYNVEDCGIAVYDARVMLRYDKNDFEVVATHSMILEQTISKNDQIGYMYPNPANTIAYYEIELMDNETGFVQLYDLLGNMVSVKKLSVGANKAEFDLTNLSNGIYIYKVNVNGELKVSDKLIIAK
jgi:hypothetical protein